MMPLLVRFILDRVANILRPFGANSFLKISTRSAFFAEDGYWISWYTRIARILGMVRLAGSNPGERYSNSSSVEAMMANSSLF